MMVTGEEAADDGHSEEAADDGHGEEAADDGHGEAADWMVTVPKMTVTVQPTMAMVMNTLPSQWNKSTIVCLNLISAVSSGR